MSLTRLPPPRGGLPPPSGLQMSRQKATREAGRIGAMKGGTCRSLRQISRCSSPAPAMMCSPGLLDRALHHRVRLGQPLQACATAAANRLSAQPHMPERKEVCQQAASQETMAKTPKGGVAVTSTTCLRSFMLILGALRKTEW